MDPTRRHVVALDGLRGLAVLAVVLFHAGHLTGGYLGVDVFFVLSGFLITSLLLREHADTDRISLARFWGRRARRLLPALALVLLAVAVWARTADASAIEGLRGDAFATMGYVANWHAIASGHDYWALFRTASPLEHTWSLAIEEQFYLVWPLVVLGLVRLRGRPLASSVRAVALAGAVVSYGLMQWLYAANDTARAYYGTDTRAASILLGAALAATLVGAAAVSTGARRALGAAGALGLAGLAVASTRLAGDDALLYREGFLACAVASVAVIATVTVVPDHAVARTLAWRPLVGLGIISYGVYLWHWPVDVVLDADRVGLTGWPLVGVQFAVTLALAFASFHLVEQPIRRGRGSARLWVVAAPAAVVLVATAVVVGTLGGVNPPAAGSDAGANLARPHGLDGEKLLVDRHFPPSVPRVVMVGDSLAFSLAEGAPRDRDTPFAVAGAAMLGCGMIPGKPLGTRVVVAPRVCALWPKVWRQAVRTFRPRALVLLTGVWDIWPHRVDGHDAELYSPRLAGYLDRALAEGAAIARDAGIPLMVLTVPCLHPSAREIALTGDGITDPKRARWFNDRLRRLAANTPGVHLIDVGRRVCRTGELGPDGVHFSLPAAAAAWKWLTPRLTPLLG